MAEVDTLMLSGEHSDIRREAVEHTNEIVKENLKGVYDNTIATKDARYAIENSISNSRQDLSKQVDAIDDTLTDKLFTLSRESADNRAQITALGFQVRDGFSSVAKDNEISVLKNTIEGQKNTQYLSDRIGAEGEKTRALLTEYKNSDLNRMLVERNADLVGEREHARHWRGFYDNAQYSALTSQFNAFQSQLQETRQGMVNFGTMAGVGQSSTSNNVR